MNKVMKTGSSISTMISLRQALAIFAVAMSTIAQNVILQVQASGLQSGPSSGAMYAGGMYFDKGDDTLYMTGIHYNDDIESDNDKLFTGSAPDTDSSSCFIASMRLNYDESTSSYAFDGIGDWASKNNDANQESCATLALHKPSQIVVIGTKEMTSSTSPPLEGSMSVFERNDIGSKKLSETTLVDQDDTMTRLVYPVAITSDSKSSDYLYLVVLASKDARDNSASASGKYPNWLKVQRYGSSFDMHVSKIKLSQGNGAGIDGIATGSVIASKEWTTEFPLNRPDDRVFIGGIIHKSTSDQNGLVIVVGSTRGSGPGYGLSDGNDEDGFVTVIDPSTGSILGVGAREGSPEDDIVTGVCDDPSDPNHFFIVGATEGDMGGQQADDSINVSTDTLQPFLRQVATDRNSNDSDNSWTMQWAVTKGLTSKDAFGSAIGCVVDQDYVYVAGTVNDGASLVQGRSVVASQGGDDVWIAKIDKKSQKVKWISQLGSDGDDRLARYGGIAIDKAGHPIIYGDTNGDIYRTRTSSEDDSVEDMFVMSLDKDYGTELDSSNDEFVGGISNRVMDIFNDEGVGGVPTAYPTYLTFSPTDEPTPDNGKNNEDTNSFNPIGLQIQGPAYAGGIVYDSVANSVLLTGATFMDATMGLNPTSLCFTGLVDLDSGKLKQQIPRGSSNLAETCNSITYDTNRNAAYAIGMSEANNKGFFQGAGNADSLGTSGGSDWLQGEKNARSGGLILQVNGNIQLVGGNRDVEHPVVYPVSVVTHPVDKDYLFVASIASKNTGVNGAFGAGSSHPNFLDRNSHKYGSEFFLTIDRYQVTDVPDVATAGLVYDVPNTLKKNWFSDFSTDGGEDVHVSGMVMAGNGNVLVVVGSTRGDGGPFDDNEGTNDMDGFIFKIDPEDGNLVDKVDGSKSSTRLDSVNKKDDYILNVCNDRFDHDAIYVVGKSEGHIRHLSDADQPPEGSTHAYVAKVNLKTMRAEWLNHFVMSIPGDGVMHGEALACTVTPDSNGENIVYVGGTVDNGASVDSNTGSLPAHGKDDIFVASMNGGTGDMHWIQQMGTSENDRLATGQGLDVDSFGNVIVYAETTGNFYGKHKSGSDAPDLVMLTMKKQDGTYLTPRTNGNGVGSDAVEDIKQMVSVPRNGIPAIQTNDDDIPSYAGGMHYDRFTNAIYLTGASYTSDDENVSKSSHCLFGIATLPQLQWMEKETIGTTNAPEACNAISLSQYEGRSEPIIVGSSEQSGLLDNLRTARHSNQYGLVLDFQNNGGSFDFVGGTVVDEEKVQFPVQVLGDNDKVFLVSMASKSDEVQPDSDRADGRKYPNLTTGGIEKYGAQYEILVERHTIVRESDLPPGSRESTMILDWRKPLETADQRSIFVSGMAIIDDGDALIVVGSTQGAEKGDDFDGIMAKVSTKSGSFASEGDNARSVAYFSSVSGANDWILSVCPDRDDERFFYVTGATGGQMDDSIDKSDSDITVHAVVSKIQTDTLNIIWTTQYEVTHASSSTAEAAASVALGCAMVPDEGYLYIAGDVENGAILEGATESAGGDDIFVAMLDTNTGEKIWTKQVGSSGDDRIARGGGIVVDADGNAVVFGDTTGSFLRMRDPKAAQTSDLFLMTFNQDDGSHENSMSNQSATKKNTSVKANPAPKEWFGTNYSRDPKFVGMITGVIISALVLAMSCAVLYRRTKARHELAKQNSIFTYLQQFPVEDIDLRKSPPGGWHGTYLNKLAHGVNTRASLPDTPYKDEDLDEDDQVLFESAKMLHSANVEDSLFMDLSSRPNLGGYRDYNDADVPLKARNKSESNAFSII